MAASSIVIVEDEAVVALDLRVQLTKLGYDVLDVAASGEAAIESVAHQVPDLILMDVRLQGEMDGIDAATEIRRHNDVPVVFLTSHSDDDTVQRAAQTAPYGYLTKPFQIRELRAGIEVALTKARMERQLRESDRWFAQTLRCVADGVIVTDMNACVRFANPAAEQLTGWTLEEALGRPIGDMVRFDLSPVAAPELGDEPSIDPGARTLAVLAQGRPLPATHAVHLIARDGSRRVVDETVGPVDNDRGGRLGAVLVLRDVSDRVAQETRLKASEERFRSAFDHAPLGMALVSLSGEFLQVNAALCRMLGATAEQLRQLGHHACSVAADRDHEMQRLNELFTGEASVVQFERRYRPVDGAELVWALVSVSVLREATQATCYLYQVHDLTEQKRAAQHLAELAEERMKREATELASVAKSEFLSRASHEMRTPLHAVLGFTQLLEMQGESDPGRAKNYVHQIRVAGEHLLTLVSDLLDINRTSKGTLKMVLQPVQLRPAVAEAVDLLQSIGHSHGIDLQVSIPEDLTVFVDPVRLRQVLLNLGSNAIKYNRQGGRVLFSATAWRRTRVGLEVADTGIGMTPDQLDQLFQPFNRLGLERTRIPGVGLGMVIVKGLVTEMGGTISIESTPRGGTKIFIDLPAAI